MLYNELVIGSLLFVDHLNNEAFVVLWLETAWLAVGKENVTHNINTHMIYT